MMFNIQGPEAGVDFQVDTLSIVENQQAADVILNDADFEESKNSSLWFCDGFCQGTRVTDAYSGEMSYKASSRYANK